MKSYLFKSLRFLFFPLYILSFFVKRNEKIWIFGAHQNRFCENSKFLFLYCSNNHPEIKAVWISGDRNLVNELKEKKYFALERWSLRGLYYALISKYYFFNVYSDDINFYTSGNATLINLWHGIPLKKIEFDIEKGPLKKIFNSNISFFYKFFKPYLFIYPNYVISTSPKTSGIFSSALKVKQSNCLDFGYPRVDVLYNNNLTYFNKLELRLYSKIYNYKKKEKKEIIFYMPTWRSNNKDFLKDSIPNYDKLNDVLLKKNVILFIKLHPNSISKFSELSNIKFIDSKIDIYSILNLSDYLITDYSSIYFDYLHLNKEIIFYPFDIKNYMNKDRDLYYSYEDVTPGIKAYNFNELLEVISDLHNLEFKQELKKIKNKFWQYNDGKASERIVKFFKGLK